MVVVKVGSCARQFLAVIKINSLLAYLLDALHVQGYVEMCLPVKEGGGVLRVLRRR